MELPGGMLLIENFFLASDYVRTYTDLATMESANEAARRAVNGILESVEFPEKPCGVCPFGSPPYSRTHARLTSNASTRGNPTNPTAIRRRSVHVQVVRVISRKRQRRHFLP